MLKRILIANRGEIAVRVIRACREMSIETVAVYSEADRGSLFTTLADKSVCIGAAPAAQSYLKQDALLTVALSTGCDAIHPGFGFLSENPEFAQLTNDQGLAFIGPNPETISLFGDKSAARSLVKSLGLPVVPGSDGPLGSAAEARALAEKLGYPVLIKAVAGGGGRGIRRIDAADEMTEAFTAAALEARSAFGNDALYLEKLIVSPRHIEVQILADSKGTILHLGNRDCSLQRRNQKLLEESPACLIDEELKTAMEDAALQIARAAHYVNAGTVEFVLDDQGRFYFIEMNSRIQVEHPVTEMVTGVNIVLEQIRIASGLPLPYSQDEIVPKGHAIECRVNAEDPLRGFAPSAGLIEHMHMPGGFGVRIDTALHCGCWMSPYYDSMIAKIIVFGKTRNEAISRMRRSLEETLITGIQTNVGLLYMLMYRPEFLSGHVDTGFIERKLDCLLLSL